MRRLRGPWLSPGEQIFSIEHRSYPGLDNLLIVFKCGEDYNEHETDAELLTQKKKKTANARRYWTSNWSIVRFVILIK